MENENQNRMEGLPSELMEGLRNPPRLEVPAFDPAWLDKEPAHLYRPEPTKGKLLSFPVLGGLSAVAAAASRRTYYRACSALYARARAPLW